jgi:adenine-specific DNA methylase
MGPTLAPIEAGARKGPPALANAIDIDTEVFEVAFALVRQSKAAVEFDQVAVTRKAVHEGNTQLPGNMVVTRPRPTQNLIA